MKKALVLSLFVMLGVGVACSAQLQGTWDTWLKLDLDPFELAGFYSFLDIQYLVGGWTLESAAIIDAEGLDTIWFEAYGSLGAFSMWSLVTFGIEDTAEGDGVQTGTFTTFQNVAAVSIAGVDLYAAFMLGDVFDYTACDFEQTQFGTAYPSLGLGAGFALGGIGTAGDIKIGAEVTWNMYSILWDVWLYGVAGVADWTYTACGSDMWYPYWVIGGLTLINTGCDVTFSGITAIAEFPICCADVYVGVSFSCTGFDYLCFLAKNIDIGLDWINIYELQISYGLNSKSVSLYIKIVTGDVVCFKPYLSVVMDGATIQGIELNALTLSCTVGGCEFFWGHIFDDTMMKYSSYYWPCISGYAPYVDHYYFTASGTGVTTTEQCAFSLAWTGTPKTYTAGSSDPAGIWTGPFNGEIYPNEVFSISCDEDSCCGGLFSFGVANFFAAGSTSVVRFWNPDAVSSYGCVGGWRFGTADNAAYTGIFGWMGTYVELSVGVGSNVSLEGGMKVSAFAGVESLAFGVNVAW